MILILTGSDDATADYLCERLNQEKISFARFDTDTESSCIECSFDVAGPALRLHGQSYAPLDFSNVWFRRPKPLKVVVDAPPAELLYIANEWSEAIESFLAHIPFARWVNHPTRNANASHKLEQLSRAQSFGLLTPDTIVTQNPDTLRRFWNDCNEKVVVKPITCGYIERSEPERDSLIYTSAIRPADLEDLSTLRNCPTLFQRQIEKADDVRLTVVDERMAAVSLRASDDGHQRVDIRRDNMADVTYAALMIPSEIQTAVLALVRSYELRFAAIDFVIDLMGRWHFLEVNPNGQWAWLDLVGACDIASFFVDSFSQSAG